MTEDEARTWIFEQHGPVSLDRLEKFVELLLAENCEQNLISAASVEQIWVRHIMDSAQLARLAATSHKWLDVGSGPGLPGVVLACLSDRPIVLVEPRLRRAQFLEKILVELDLGHASVRQKEIGRVTDGPYDAVTARAYAPLSKIFSSVLPLTNLSTIWVLPKGRSAQRELAEATTAWQGVFHVEQSLTDADAGIIVARAVHPR